MSIANKRIIYLCLLAIVFQGGYLFLVDVAIAQSENPTEFCRLGNPEGLAMHKPDGADIQWFKNQLEISPKYQERQRGVAGMSWLHFLTMAFLALFSTGALIAFYLWNRKTKLILRSLLEEDKHGGKKG